MAKFPCKWVREDMTTANDTKWQEGVANKLPPGAGGLHYYEHPFLAVIFKDTHGLQSYSKLYRVKPRGKIVRKYDGCESSTLTLIHELEIPEFTTIQRIAFGILCSLQVYSEPIFVTWAEKWLSGQDRSAECVHTAFEDIKAYHAANPTNASGRASWAYEKAAGYAVYAASLYARKIGDPNALDAARAVEYSNRYADRHMGGPIDLISLAKRAMEIQ